MAGIYIHIPFCRKACHYCDFHFSTSTAQVQRMSAAVLREAELAVPSFADEPVETIYFGGGTPGFIPPADIAAIIGRIRSLSTIIPDAEITLEANPDDITLERARQWSDAGVNRLSIGIQSFRDIDLQSMNRSHTAAAAEASVGTAHAAGITNLSLDLIYALPGLSSAAWEENVQRALSLGAGHLSAYCLTVEPRTALSSMVAKGKVTLPPEDAAEKHYHALIRLTREAGMEHYEVSNFARPGMRSRHNSAYWTGRPYLGLGPSAHSFDGERRWWNVANNAAYIKVIEAGKLPKAVENLESYQRFNERILIGLRTAEGIRPSELERAFGFSFSREDKILMAELAAEGMAIASAHDFRLTDRGMLHADGIAGRLFRV